MDRVLYRRAHYSVHVDPCALDPRGRTLLVGDRPAPSAPDDPDFHYTPFGAITGSSLWLNLQLHHAEIPESQLAWVNAADLHGTVADHAVLRARWLRVVALGGNANRWVLKAGLPKAHVHVMHPQAWKRFHAREPYPLITLLRRVVL